MEPEGSILMLWDPRNSAYTGGCPKVTSNHGQEAGNFFWELGSQMNLYPRLKALLKGPSPATLFLVVASGIGRDLEGLKA